MKVIKVGTLFSGIGSFEFALKRLGLKYEILFACDNGGIEIKYDQKSLLKKIKGLNSNLEKNNFVKELYKTKSTKTNYVEKTYLKNFPCKEENYYQDICLFDGSLFSNKIDILVGGSPCQSFSIVGKQKGFDDNRGQLFFEYIRVLKETKPKVFIYENVQGVLNNKNKETWKIMQDEFARAGYIIYPSVYNAENFNIPQNRKRLIVVGFENKNIVYDFPKELGCCYTMQDFLIESTHFGGMSYSKNGDIIFDRLPGVIDDKYFLSKAVYKYVMKGGTKGWYQKPEIDLLIARPLLATMGNHHRSGVDNYVTVNNMVRGLSEREAARLMGFTDDFEIVVSKAQAYKQFGNSIVVDVLMAVVKSVLETRIFDIENQ